MEPERRRVLDVAATGAGCADRAGTNVQELEQIGFDFSTARAKTARANQELAKRGRPGGHTQRPSSIARQMRSRTRRISRRVCMPAGVTA